jgi:hypothetical protein
MAFDPQGQAGTPGDDDLYEVLGLFPTATPDEVDAAYHRLLNGLITTVANTGEAAERLRRRRIRLAHAYAVLADPAQRAAYDARIGVSAAPASASAPPVRMPAVTPPETTPPPAPMPVVAPPATIPPPVSMPEVRPPQPAPPAPEPPGEAAPIAVIEPESEQVGEDAGAAELTAPVEETPILVAAEPEPAAEVEETTRPLDGILVEEPQPVEEPAAEIAARGTLDEVGTDLPMEEPAPVVDDTPAPWQAPGAPAPAMPVIKERPAPRRTPERRGAERRPAAAAGGAAAPRPAGGVALPSRKVAEATPLPAPRTRFTAAEEAPPARDRDGADDDELETRPLGGRRAAAGATATPIARERPRAPAPAPRRAKKAGRGNWLQVLFYGSMAFILVVGTIAGFASTIVTTPSGPLTSPGTANAAGDAALQAGNYSEAIRQYNAALSNNGSDPHALLGLAKAYYYKAPSEPDIAREYLARVFTTAGTDTPEGQEALQLLTTIGLPQSNAPSPTAGSPVAGTPGGTPGTVATPGAGAAGTPGLVATPGTGATAPAGGTAGPATPGAPGTDTAPPTAPGAPGPSTVAPAGTVVP